MPDEGQPRNTGANQLTGFEIYHFMPRYVRALSRPLNCSTAETIVTTSQGKLQLSSHSGKNASFWNYSFVLRCRNPTVLSDRHWCIFRFRSVPPGEPLQTSRFELELEKSGRGLGKSAAQSDNTIHRTYIISWLELLKFNQWIDSWWLNPYSHGMHAYHDKPWRYIFTSKIYYFQPRGTEHPVRIENTTSGVQNILI